MRELEEYLARERAETLGRSLKRKLTRQERARRQARRRVALILVSSFFAGFVITVALLTWAPATQAANRAALESRMEQSGFAQIDEEDGELPF